MRTSRQYWLPHWHNIFDTLHAYSEEEQPPSVSLIAQQGTNPYRILVTAIISLRTRDEVTIKVAKTLFSKARTPTELLALPEDEISELLFPAGFYKTKATQLHKIADLLVNCHNGQVPSDPKALLNLPGVGRKTANLVLNLAFGVKAICVDTHLHRIANRMGWVTTANADETELALQKILPEEYWIEANELLAAWGHDICKPASPLCSQCGFAAECPKIGVHSAR